MAKQVTLEEVLELAKQLSPLDKLRLIERVTPQIKRELTIAQAKPRKSLRGLWRGIDITDEDIVEVRQQMWGNFPREDI
ncbi:hypothetical protein [Scytonema sp. NUACC26]|uniref:hypothetical protein n=1 Tax=Scytonema sp. NUACC26 TaxID=3140176 RepID=UPI0034DC948E